MVWLMAMLLCMNFLFSQRLQTDLPHADMEHIAPP